MDHIGTVEKELMEYNQPMPDLIYSKSVDSELDNAEIGSKFRVESNQLLLKNKILIEKFIHR